MENSILVEKMNDVIECIELYNEALTANEATEIKSAEVNLKEAEKSYAKAKADEIYVECGRQEKPVLYAINMYSYPVLTHTTEKDDNGVVISAELAEAEKVIDLYAMCKANRISVEWASKAAQSCTSYVLLAAESFGFSKAQRASVCNSLNFQRKAAQHDAATSDSSKKDPISKKSMTTELQSVVDSVFGIDGVAAGTYKVNSHDFEYINRVFFKKGKAALTLAVQILQTSAGSFSMFSTVCTRV